MYELALFSGVGGGMLGGSLLGWKPIGAVECESYCREVLLRRQADGMFPLFPIWDDVRTFRKDNEETKAYIEAVSELAPLVITAGFPCQPYSVAGKGAGEDDERNLWPETIRIIREVGPEVALLENVPGLLSFDYFGQVLGDLAEVGYDAEWEVVSAGQCGALHLRKRLWILAYSKSKYRGNKPKDFGNGTTRDSGSQSATSCFDAGKVAHTVCERCNECTTTQTRDSQRSANHNIEDRENRHIATADMGSIVADTNSINGGSNNRSERQSRYGCAATRKRSDDDWWATEPDVGRVADGVANRVDRLKAIGNGQVSIVAAVAFCRLAEFAGLDLRRYAPALFEEI